MRRLAMLLILAVLLATTAVASAQGAPTVTVRESPQLGRYLADSKGMTLYIFKNDKPNESTCYDRCAQLWPVFEPSGVLTLPPGVGGTLGVIERRDGKRQVTYNGMPLYYWVQDQAPGETKGHGVNNVWFVVEPQAAPAAPMQLPRTGSPALPAAAAAVAGLAALGIGLLARRR